MSDINTRAVPGNNRLLREYLGDLNADLPGYLESEHADLMTQADALKAELEALPLGVESDEAEATMTELGVRLAKFVKNLDNHRTADKAPTLAAGRIIDSFFSPIANKVVPCLQAAERRVNAWKIEKKRLARVAQDELDRMARLAREQAEAARLEAERIAKDTVDAEERKAAEEAARLAAHDAKAAEAAAKPAPVVIQPGPQAKQKTYWTGTITDLETLDLIALRTYISRGALDDAVVRYARATKGTPPLTGAKIEEKSETAFKG